MNIHYVFKSSAQLQLSRCLDIGAEEAKIALATTGGGTNLCV